MTKSNNKTKIEMYLNYIKETYEKVNNGIHTLENEFQKEVNL